jgi:hypothetical protein
LIARLMRCADSAGEAGFVFSEQQLDRMADSLERRLDLMHKS